MFFIISTISQCLSFDGALWGLQLDQPKWCWDSAKTAARVSNHQAREGSGSRRSGRAFSAWNSKHLTSFDVVQTWFGSYQFTFDCPRYSYYHAWSQTREEWPSRSEYPKSEWSWAKKEGSHSGLWDFTVLQLGGLCWTKWMSICFGGSLVVCVSDFSNQ